MVPYVRKSFRKHYKDGLKYFNNFVSDIEKNDEKFFTLFAKINGVDKEQVYDIPIDHDFYNMKGYSKAHKYAMDMTKREVYQAVEAMYHNLK